MIRFTSRPFVCWRCLVQNRSSLGANLGASKSPGASSINLQHRTQPAQRRLATTSHTSPLVGPYGQASIPKAGSAATSGKPPIKADKDQKPPIREVLRLWKPTEDTPISPADPGHMKLVGSIGNILDKAQSTGSAVYDQLRTRQVNLESFGGEVATGDSEVGGDYRIPGDLVEMQTNDSRAPVLAVYLGFFSGRNHFYGSNGRWMTSLGFSPLFTVSNFASRSELEPVLDRIPNNATPDEVQNLLNNNEGPSRNEGSALIQKMSDFKKQAERVYQGNLATLDGIQALVSSPRRVKYLSLFEIAEIALPDSIKVDDSFTPAALYATHTAIFRTEFGFTPLSPSRDCHRRDHLFEILPREQTRIAAVVAVMVRAYITVCAKRLRAPTRAELEGTVFGDFVIMARKVVSSSRSKRQWTPHGILNAPAGGILQSESWSAAGENIIKFLEVWASHDLLPPGSRFHAYGATILRALELYDNAVLDQNTAWTFLQEIGVVESWEISSRYKVRFPNTTIVKGRGLARTPPDELEGSKRADIAAGSRKDWTDAAIFCIDAPSTRVIDDGVSLEHTDKPDEFWLHVHTADPSSVIIPDSELCQYMELIPENIYLPGHFQAMLPPHIGEDNSGDYGSEGLTKQFSLRSGAPALTFSAKVNRGGDILEYKIEPGTINNVVYLDPEDVSAFCNEPPPPPFMDQTMTVGTPPVQKNHPPNRTIVAAKDLGQSEKDDLTTLYHLAEAIKQKRLSKGAWPYFFPRASVSVSFPGVPAGPAGQQATEGSRIIAPDPYIKVSKESSTGCSVVANSMVLAGEVAARWCSSRGIPAPFRKDVKSAENYPAALEFATGQIYPLIDQGIEPPVTMWQELSTMTGGIEISSQPGPYFLLGLDMYAKATSPLRRFSDLMVHWQIHAVLAHERATGRRIDPATDDMDAILAFSGPELENTIALLHMREKMAGTVSRGSEQWILQALVRAWRFEKTAPRVMRFTVDSRWNMGVMGSLDFFDLHAVMDTHGIGDHVLLRDIRVGDQFEVELVDVKVHTKEVIVKAIRYLPQDATAVQQRHQHGLSPPEQEPAHQTLDPALA